ncbi:hypothetical protein CDD82_5239 [Ophiocordyceps australis]|uniref:Uncharacterized protein n=1 Tax=Ophiocordyceps australis TaxID=1399860 RepID=A0A2C5Z248_9HYPO|nr:hypothetical protein CDD82_5239 [Ophiocordyceps australis]
MAEAGDEGRMPPGERCYECGSQRWYLQDGERFCSRGHQIEGFTQFAATQEELSGRLGRVARKKTNKPSGEPGRLTQSEGRALYLEALQLLLRRELWWLVQEQNFPAQIETVVRHLWDLRIRGSDWDNHRDQIKTEAGDEPQYFSSQNLSQVENQRASKTWSRTQSWDPERGEHWPLPNPLDTLGLCYLGSVLLRTPLLIGEILRWSNDGSLPYQTAFQDLPQEMQSSLPPRYANGLKKLLRRQLKGEQFHSTIISQVLSFNFNYGIRFPGIMEIPCIVKYAALLALPIETVIVAKRLSTLLECLWEYPVDKPRLQPLDSPEILLIALVVVATKLCFPFKLCNPLIKGLPLMKWDCWKQASPDEPKQHKQGYGRRGRFDRVTPNQVVNMCDSDLEAYFQHIASIAPMHTESGLTSLFPSLRTSAEASIKPHHDTSEAATEARASHILGLALTPPPDDGALHSEAELADTHDRYLSFRKVEDLTGKALELYTAVAEASGLPLEMVVKAVYMQEQRLVSWQRHRASGSDSIEMALR